MKWPNYEHTIKIPTNLRYLVPWCPKTLFLTIKILHMAKFARNQLSKTFRTNNRVNCSTSSKYYKDVLKIEYTSTRVHEYPSTRVPEYASTRAREYASTRVYEYLAPCGLVRRVPDGWLGGGVGGRGAAPQITPASSLWPQLWRAQPACRHASSVVSDPSQSTSSSQIGPEPGPNTVTATATAPPLATNAHQGAAALTVGSVLRGTILNYVISIGHYHGAPIRQPIEMT